MAKLTVPILIDYESIKDYMASHDIVEVVRCKECEYWDTKELYCCDFLTQDEMGFCKWGKRKEDG